MALRDQVVMSHFLTGGPSLAGLLGPLVYQSTAQVENVIVVSCSHTVSSETPARVIDYVSAVVPRYDDPTFKSHFRLQRSTFEV